MAFSAGLPGQAPGGTNLLRAPMQPGQPSEPPPPVTPGVSPPLSTLPLHAGESTLQPSFPSVRFDSGASNRKLTEGEWTALSNDLYMGVTAATSARSAFDKNLEEFARTYDMIVGEKDFPYTDSSNISLPYLPSQLESLAAYIIGTTLVPRLYMVTPNDPGASEAAFMIEKYYNNELHRLRSDGSSYFGRQEAWIHMALRDGTGVLEVLWNRRRQRRRSVSYMPEYDIIGKPVVGQDGQPSWKQHAVDSDVFINDYAELTARPLKEFYLLPNEAPSIEAAAAAMVVDWLYEDQLDRMVRAGVLDSGEVERALRYVENGTTEVASDPQRIYDKNASDQIDIGIGQGSQTSKFFAKRGPLKVWRIHSNQYDMNDDGIPEENIFWLHWQSQRMLGWMPYDYSTYQRPFIAFAPLPRPDSFYGYSICERLSGVVSEMEAVHNARRDRQDISLSPPMAVKEGSRLLDNQGGWRPGQRIEVEGLPGTPEASFGLVALPDIPVSSWQEEMLLKQYGNEYTGLNSPMLGGQGQGRRSATELRQQNMASNVRINLICARLRISLGQVINFVHSLNKQYLTTSPVATQGTQFTLPLQVLSQDVIIGVAGASDPIDSITRRNENMTLFDLAMKVPMIAMNPQRVWYWMRSLLESFGRSDVYQLIGTEQEMQQQMQMQMQQMLESQEARQLELGTMQAKTKQYGATAYDKQMSGVLKQAQTVDRLGRAFEDRTPPSE